MRLMIAAIGKLRGSDPRAALIADYIDRIEKFGRGPGFSEITVKTFEAPRGMAGPVCQARESALLLAAIPEGAHAIVLDQSGDNITSTQLAKMLETLRDRGTGMAVFAIGGADGHTDAIRRRANTTIAFGRATWPHMLARLMVCEQIYRAMTILAGHPYHRQ